MKLTFLWAGPSFYSLSFRKTTLGGGGWNKHFELIQRNYTIGYLDLVNKLKYDYKVKV